MEFRLKKVNTERRISHVILQIWNVEGDVWENVIGFIGSGEIFRYTEVSPSTGLDLDGEGRIRLNVE